VPLYYAADGHRLAVASTLPALMALPGVAGTWDATALDAFLTFGTVPPPATFHTGIRQLGPGESAVWEDGRVRTQRYWQLTFPERRMTRADVPAVLREQMVEAHRLRQAGMVTGLLLSGGLDAAAVLALTSVDRRLPAAAYTAAFAERDEELRAAARFAEGAGVPHVAAVGDEDWAAAVDALMAGHGGPVGGPELVAVHRAATRAREDVGVLLAGIGGEEVFGGSRPARAAERLRRYRELPGLAREGADVGAVAPRRWAENLRRLVDQGARAAPDMRACRSALLPARRPLRRTRSRRSATPVGSAHDALQRGGVRRRRRRSTSTTSVTLALPRARCGEHRGRGAGSPSARGSPPGAVRRERLAVGRGTATGPRSSCGRARAAAPEASPAGHAALPAGARWAFLDAVLAPDRLESQTFRQNSASPRGRPQRPPRSADLSGHRAAARGSRAGRSPSAVRATG
jgi:hypothetical protein